MTAGAERGGKIAFNRLNCDRHAARIQRFFFFFYSLTVETVNQRGKKKSRAVTKKCSILGSEGVHPFREKNVVMRVGKVTFITEKGRRYIHAHVRARMRLQTHTYTYTHTHTQTHTQTRTRGTHTYTRTRVVLQREACIDMESRSGNEDETC